MEGNVLQRRFEYLHSVVKNAIESPLPRYMLLPGVNLTLQVSWLLTA